MTEKVLILGGYGNFGKRIARALVKKQVPIIIAGRNEDKAKGLADELGEYAQFCAFDVNKELDTKLKEFKPCVIINTCGPFQGADYSIAESCIANKVNYIDLADGRDFVRDISILDERAKLAGVAIISGASTVPCLSSAIIEAFKDDFTQIDEMVYGIAPGQRAERGIATTKGILSYVGKKLRPFAGNNYAFGWQDIYAQKYPEIGFRFMANCDIPDLDLLPEKYGIRKIRFSAGLELPILHLGLWSLSYLVRWGLPINLAKFAEPMLKIADFLNPLGSDDGGMHVMLRGIGENGKYKEVKWFIVAKNGDGPQIPTIPAIILAHRLASGMNQPSGSYPCVGIIKKDEYLYELKGFHIKEYRLS